MMKNLKFIFLGLSAIFFILSVVYFVPVVSSKVADEVGTRFAKDNFGVESSVSIRSLTKYKIKECSIKIIYYDVNKNIVATKNIKLEDEKPKQWYDDIDKFTAEPVGLSAEIIDYKVDFGLDIFFCVLFFLAFWVTLVSSLILIKRRFK